MKLAMLRNHCLPLSLMSGTSLGMSSMTSVSSSQDLDILQSGLYRNLERCMGGGQRAVTLATQPKMGSK